MVDTNTHRYVGNHAQEILGAMREPGEFLVFDKDSLEDAHVKDMIDSGMIVDLRSFTTKATPSNVEGSDK